MIRLTLAMVLFGGLSLLAAEPDSKLDRAPMPPAWGNYEKLSILGWTIFVDDRLRKDDNAATEAALVLLRDQLKTIVERVPAPVVAELQKVTLWFSPTYPESRPKAEYHPAASWLREHGRNPAMAKGVEFSNSAIFDKEVKRIPVFVLHELAHAYHDQVVGHDDPGILACYRYAVESKSYDAIQRSNGKIERAYAMTNDREYFAETSEAFFGENDFYPFDRAELKRHDPEMYRVLERVWRVKESP